MLKAHTAVQSLSYLISTLINLSHSTNSGTTW